MTTTSAKNAGLISQSLSGARFRQRKISVKQPLIIYKQKDIPALDLNNEMEPSQLSHLGAGGSGSGSGGGSGTQRDLQAIETGVDKNEEEEVHLQQVINAAQLALLGSKDNLKPDLSGGSNANDVSTTEGNSPKKNSNSKTGHASLYIPTPDASRIWPDAKKFYGEQIYREPKSYVKFSATVENCSGVEYNMDESDEAFLTEMNKLITEIQPCSESEFEIICERMEKVINERQSYLSLDPGNIMSYKELSAFIMDEFMSTNKGINVASNSSDIRYMSTSTIKDSLARELHVETFSTLFDKHPSVKGHGVAQSQMTRPVPELIRAFGEKIYRHWKQRKVERHGKSIHPVLKFEDPNANEKENDADPYICFRRREFRPTRKTRRADTLGAERVRLLQKSLHRARDLVLAVAKRESLKGDVWSAEEDIFTARAEAKNLKRVVGVKGDDYLFYSHKRKRVNKVKEETDANDAAAKMRRIERRKHDVNSSGKDGKPGAQSLQGATNLQQSTTQLQSSGEAGTSTSQPYVKLPPSKIPDMDLVTIAQVLSEKHDTINRAAMEKLRKRKEQDKGFVNLTDETSEPFFNITTSESHHELSHVPYSSIAAASYHQFDTSNYLGDDLRRMIEDGQKPLPGVKTFRGSNGELIPSKPFPLLSTLIDSTDNDASQSYIARLLKNIETNNFSAYTDGYNVEPIEQNSLKSNSNTPQISDPILRLRKRAGRSNRTFIDRRGLFNSSVYVSPLTNNEQTSSDPNIYDCEEDRLKRSKSNWMFDNDLLESQLGRLQPFSLDPSKLNCISDETQSIRFGSMLLSKSYGLLRESVHQKQQSFIQHAKMRALQQQQLSNKQLNTKNAPSQSNVEHQRRVPPPTASISRNPSSLIATNPDVKVYSSLLALAPPHLSHDASPSAQETPQKASIGLTGFSNNALRGKQTDAPTSDAILVGASKSNYGSPRTPTLRPTVTTGDFKGA